MFIKIKEELHYFPFCFLSNNIIGIESCPLFRIYIYSQNLLQLSLFKYSLYQLYINAIVKDVMSYTW